MNQPGLNHIVIVKQELFNKIDNIKTKLKLLYHEGLSQELGATNINKQLNLLNMIGNNTSSTTTTTKNQKYHYKITNHNLYSMAWVKAHRVFNKYNTIPLLSVENLKNVSV